MILFVFISIDGIFCALKFEKEADKGEWVKKTFFEKNIHLKEPA